MLENSFKLLAISLLAFSLSSCASGPHPILYASNTDAQIKMTELQERIKDDRKKHYAREYSSYLDCAEMYLSEAQDRLEAEQSNQSVLEDEAIAESRLQFIEENQASSAQL